MISLDRESEIVQLAVDLKLDPGASPTSAILDFCNRRIADWLDADGGVGSLKELEDLVCDRLGLVFEEFGSDEEFHEIIDRYVAMGEFVFATQRDGFAHDTFATLIRRDRVTSTCPDRFVAIIDCRGVKAYRRFFTRWHEIAHVLTLVDGQMLLPLHRSTAERDATEQLMDKIAGEIGFYDPIFRPAVDAAVSGSGSFSLSLVDELRESMCPSASFQATLIAATRRVSTPAISLEARLGLKEGERKRAANRSLFPEMQPEPKLRVLKVGGNDASRQAKLRLHRNMQVPATSVIARVFDNQVAGGEARAIESLSDWVTSDGESVGTGDVVVDARGQGKWVVALVTPAG